MKISNEEADERAREEFPFKPRWRPTTTSEAKADDREQYLLSVIAQLYERLDDQDEIAIEKNEAAERID